MSGDKDSGDKTEKPTPKKLQDARKKGDVAKSKDVSSTVGLLVWFVIAALATTFFAERLAALMLAAIASIHNNADGAMAFKNVSSIAVETLLTLSAAIFIPVLMIGLLIEFLQVGPIFTGEKMKLKFEHLNPAEGIKKMFGADNLVEILKSLAKTILLCLIGWLVIRATLAQIVGLMNAPEQLGTAIWAVTKQLLAWTIGIFVLVSILDTAWQRYSFTKKMRMSMRDIKQETKESEGDPYIKAQRKQTHMEWSQRNAANAAGAANVLVVNPTHVAIAIDYDKETCPVPTIAYKGEDLVAKAMRESAEENGVPILRNVPLARDLLARAEVGEIVPRDLFDVIAEVILWAKEVREEMEQDANTDIGINKHASVNQADKMTPGDSINETSENKTDAADKKHAKKPRTSPGEDLTLDALKQPIKVTH
jgi:type III secretion protein U